MRAPDFWNRNGLVPTLLAPASWAWSAAARLRRTTATPERVSVPVICVGNLTTGGAGKTPTVLALLETIAARAQGRPIAHALIRGYGGTLPGPVRVDPTRHTAAEVGDEALLLARAAPTWVAHDRVAGALAAAATGARVIIMDDGFQNPALAKDLSLVVVDGETGFGNRRVMPAGPLREPIKAGLKRADAVVVIGDDITGVSAEVHTVKPSLPILTARLAPSPASPLQSQRVFAFAGIGRPEKFFATLAASGATVVGQKAFPDHYLFKADDIAALEIAAKALNARLVTTEKDYVRLDALAQRNVATLPVTLTFDDTAALAALLEPVLAQASISLRASHG
jgi:tetraacyldisaccharide 4'-kinase